MSDLDRYTAEPKHRGVIAWLDHTEAVDRDNGGREIEITVRAQVLTNLLAAAEEEDEAAAAASSSAKDEL